MAKAPSKRIPKNLQAVLWSVDVRHLDLERDKAYIIHQVLLYGTFEEIRWLFTAYHKDEIIETFVHRPMKMYPKNAFHFIKNFVLGLENAKLLEERYVTAISGPVEPRATRSL